MPAAKVKSSLPSILIAEKDVIVRLTLAEHLRSCGLMVYEAASAMEAKAILIAGVRIDILLSDAQLAGPISGFALAQWVRRNRPGVAVILTGALHGKAQAATELCERAAKRPSPHDAVTLSDRIAAMMAERDRRMRRPSTASQRTPRQRERKRQSS